MVKILYQDVEYTRCQVEVTESFPGLFATATNAEWLFLVDCTLQLLKKLPYFLRHVLNDKQSVRSLSLSASAIVG